MTDIDRVLEVVERVVKDFQRESETGVRISFGSDPVGVMIKGEYQDNCCKIVIPLHLLEESLEIPAHIDMNLREIEDSLAP